MTEVDKLLKNGRFGDGLTLDVKLAWGYELQPGELVRQPSYFIFYVSLLGKYMQNLKHVLDYTFEVKGELNF